MVYLVCCSGLYSLQPYQSWNFLKYFRKLIFHEIFHEIFHAKKFHEILHHYTYTVLVARAFCIRCIVLVVFGRRKICARCNRTDTGAQPQHGSDLAYARNKTLASCNVWDMLGAA